MTNPRWTHCPPGSNWGDFGPDQLGRINLVTPEKRARVSRRRARGLLSVSACRSTIPAAMRRSAPLSAAVAADPARRGGPTSTTRSRERPPTTIWRSLPVQHSRQWDSPAAGPSAIVLRKSALMGGSSPRVTKGHRRRRAARPSRWVDRYVSEVLK
jgi:hypothetical protein